jgi:hypothetical protein
MDQMDVGYGPGRVAKTAKAPSMSQASYTPYID